MRLTGAKAYAVRHVHAGKGVVLLVLKGLNTRGKGHLNQIGYGKVDFDKAVRIGAGNGRLHHVVVRQAVDQVRRLALEGADGHGVEQPVPVVEEAVGHDAFFLAKVFGKVGGVNRIHGHVVLLAIGEGMGLVGVAPEQAAHG